MPRKWNITHVSGKGIQIHNDRTTDKHDYQGYVQIQAVLRHQNSKAVYSVPKEAEKYLHEAGTTDDTINDHGKTATWKAKQLKLKYKADFKKMVRDKWKEKAMHGKFPNYLDKDHVDVELSFEWMKPTGLKGETEGLIRAAPDQALNTRYYSNHTIMQGITDRYRMCHTPARNSGTHHIRVPNTSSRSVP